MGQGGAGRLTIGADRAPPRLMPRLGMLHGVAGGPLRMLSEGSMLIAMKATIDIPDDLYQKLSARSAEQGQPVDAVAVDLLRRGLDEETDTAATNARLEAVERMIRLAQEF